MAKRTVKFPKRVYVKWEDDTTAGSRYLVVEDQPNFAEEGDKVAIYELFEVKTKHVQHLLK